MKFVLLASGDYSFDKGLYIYIWLPWQPAITNCHRDCCGLRPRPQLRSSPQICNITIFFPNPKPCWRVDVLECGPPFFKLMLGQIRQFFGAFPWIIEQMWAWVTAWHEWQHWWQCEWGRQEESGNVLLDAFVRVCHELWHLDDSQWDGNGKIMFDLL